jgi:hypothetical protein
MDKELKKLIDEVMAPLERFYSERKRIVTAVLAESSGDLPHDDYFYSAWANSVTQELERREILRRAQESWMMRHLIDRLSQLESEEDSLPKSETDGAENKGWQLDRPISAIARQ